MSTTQEATEHQFLVDLSKHLGKPGLYFLSIPNGYPVYNLRPRFEFLVDKFKKAIAFRIITTLCITKYSLFLHEHYYIFDLEL